VEANIKKNTIFSVLIDFLKFLLLMGIFLLSYGCTIINQPPLELAPNGEIVTKALSLQLEKKYTHLGRNLQINPLNLEITEINVERINPFFRANLPVYHLQGRYNLNLQLTNKKVTQKNKPFDVYLQRQKEGKTWHLISQNN
jgi:hypothetical protein